MDNRVKRASVAEVPVATGGTASEVEPLPTTEWVDELLNSKMKGNRALELESASFATKPELMNRADFNKSKKMILAEFLNLVADSLESAHSENLSQSVMQARRKKLRAAVKTGAGQVLRRLRPRERVARQLNIWKANSREPKGTMLRPRQMALLLGPNLLIDPTFLKLVEHEMQQSNGKIARGHYRTFMLLPFDELEGGTSSLLPYVRIADELHFHVIGSKRMNDTLDEVGRLRDEWRFRLSDVLDEEQDILANATVVANEVVLRPAHESLGETEPLTCGAHWALASQMTRYFQRRRDGHWYISFLYPGRRARDFRTVNTVAATRAKLHAAALGCMNVAYTVSESEDEKGAGVHTYGGMTMFPVDQIDLESLGNQVIPTIQSQARVTRNRIYFFLVTQLERFIGGDLDEDDVRSKIRKYLDDMKLAKQIVGFKVVLCKKESTGKFRIKVEIRWVAQARAFEIDLSEDAVANGQSNSHQKEN